MTRAKVIYDARRVADRLSGDALTSVKREGEAIRSLIALASEQRRQLRACRRCLRMTGIDREWIKRCGVKI